MDSLRNCPDYVHEFSLPSAMPYQAYSVRLLLPAYTGPIVQVARAVDGELADIYAENLAHVTELIVVSTSQSLNGLASI